MLMVLRQQLNLIQALLKTKEKLTFGAAKESTEAERQASGAFRTLAPYRDGNIYSAKFSGDGAWERHPNGDELVQIVPGANLGKMLVKVPRRQELFPQCHLNVRLLRRGGAAGTGRPSSSPRARVLRGAGPADPAG